MKSHFYLKGVMGTKTRLEEEAKDNLEMAIKEARVRSLYSKLFSFQPDGIVQRLDYNFTVQSIIEKNYINSY